MNANSSIPQVSVVLATYNPREDYLRRVIEGLKVQTLKQSAWELVVVDNNSKPALQVSGSQLLVGSEDKKLIDLNWHPDARLVVETQQGLSHARRRGFQEAKGELIVNLDDDAVLDPDYLQQVVRAAKRFPFIGAFGCQLRPQFEEPPQWPVGDYYAAERTVREDIWSNDREHISSTPFGAGSVVRREVAEAYTRRMLEDPRWGLLGRTAEKLLSCEDIEIAMTACDLGLGKGVFKDLRLTHLIMARKMTLEFMCRNAHGNGYSSVVHNYLRFGRMPCKPSVIGRLNRLYRLWRMSPRKRREETAKDRGIREGREMVLRLMAQQSRSSS